MLRYTVSPSEQAGISGEEDDEATWNILGEYEVREGRECVNFTALMTECFVIEDETMKSDIVWDTVAMIVLFGRASSKAVCNSAMSLVEEQRRKRISSDRAVRHITFEGKEG